MEPWARYWLYAINFVVKSIVKLLFLLKINLFNTGVNNISKTEAAVAIGFIETKSSDVQW